MQPGSASERPAAARGFATAPVTGITNRSLLPEGKRSLASSRRVGQHPRSAALRPTAGQISWARTDRWCPVIGSGTLAVNSRQPRRVHVEEKPTQTRGSKSGPGRETNAAGTAGGNDILLTKGRDLRADLSRVLQWRRTRARLLRLKAACSAICERTNVAAPFGRHWNKPDNWGRRDACRPVRLAMGSPPFGGSLRICNRVRGVSLLGTHRSSLTTCARGGSVVGFQPPVDNGASVWDISTSPGFDHGIRANP
jgi:hypothetical protein